MASEKKDKNPQASGSGAGGRRDHGAWSSIISWLREDPELADWLSDAEANIPSNDRMANMPVWKALTLYQGFDIKRIARDISPIHSGHTC
jgi:hypothetical protein